MDARLACTARAAGWYELILNLVVDQAITNLENTKMGKDAVYLAIL